MTGKRDRGTGDDGRKGKRRAQSRKDAKPNQRHHRPWGLHNPSRYGRHSIREWHSLVAKTRVPVARADLNGYILFAHMKVSVIIPAAGLGTRMAAPAAKSRKSTPTKQFAELAGTPILVHTLRRFAES